MNPASALVMPLAKRDLIPVVPVRRLPRVMEFFTPTTLARPNPDDAGEKTEPCFVLFKVQAASFIRVNALL